MLISAADNIAFHQEKPEKEIVANIISKYRNFSCYNYYSISSFFALAQFTSFG